jgi:FMN phosphatase YigB (HAD superfamily)
MGQETIRAVFFDLGDTLVTTADRQWVLGARALLASLKTRSLRLGVISNTGNLTRDQLKPLLPIDFDWGLFESDLIILSSEVGAEKPSHAIFETAIAKARIPASTCLFCTESLVDTLAAQAVGMVAARVTKPPDSELDKLVDSLLQAQLIS